MAATEKTHNGVLRVRWCLSCGTSFQTSEVLWGREAMAGRVGNPNLQLGNALSNCEKGKSADIAAEAVDQVPERWPNCRHYDDCLTRAALADGELSCEGCRRYEAAPPDREGALRDALGCYELVRAVFYQ